MVMRNETLYLGQGGSSALSIGTNTFTYPFNVNGAANIIGQGIVGGTLKVQSNQFSVGVSTLAVTGGKVGVGTASPSAMLDVSGTIGAWSRTMAQINALVPTAVGQIVFCNNCTVTNLCVSTGTAVAQFLRVDSTTAGCGTGN